VAWTGIAVIWLSLFGSTVGLMIDKWGKHFLIDADLLAVTRQSEAPAASDQLPRVLCDHDTADVLVPLATLRVYCGNHYKTPDWQAKVDRQAAAGIEPEIAAERLVPDQRRSVLRELLSEQKIDYLVLRHTAAAYTDIHTLPSVHLVATKGGWSLYRIEPALASSAAGGRSR
jgi:hypothetical protein